MAFAQGSVRGRGHGNEGGLSRAFHGGRQIIGHGDRTGAHGR